MSCFLLIFSAANAAELRGQVFDAATFVGLEGAVVTLDQLPPDGTPEFTMSADVITTN